jgi:hypothetical protein
MSIRRGGQNREERSNNCNKLEYIQYDADEKEMM